MELDLKGRVALITGPAKGMGAAVTRAFAAEGCSLVLASRDVEAMAPIAAEAAALGVAVHVATLDLTDTDACVALARAAEERFGRIDALVHVAGGSGPLGKNGWEVEREEFDEIVDLNLTGTFNIMRAVLPGMVARRYGKIVNVGGTFGMRGRAGRMAYSASKWGLRGVTKSMALEAGPYNVNINCVAPGMVDGPRFRTKVLPDMAKRLGITVEQAFDRHAEEYALRRITLDEDVAKACLFLASDAARQISGVDLPVDGGWAML